MTLSCRAVLLGLTVPLIVAIVVAASSRQAASDGEAFKEVDAILTRADREVDMDRKGRILSELLQHKSGLAAAFAKRETMNSATAYIVIGGNWGRLANVPWRDRIKHQSELLEAIRLHPELVASALRQDRLTAFLDLKNPRGAITINSYPFFSGAPYCDDLLEQAVETLRIRLGGKADAVRDFSGRVLVSQEEVEASLLETWLLACGLGNRLDLIRNTSRSSWRTVFPEFDTWFKSSRPFMRWNNDKECIEIDMDARTDGRPTARTERAIPPLKPPWMVDAK